MLEMNQSEVENIHSIIAKMNARLDVQDTNNKRNVSILLVIFLAFWATLLVMGAITVALLPLPQNELQAFDFLSSWLAVFIILIGGFLSSLLVGKFSIKGAVGVTFAWASILTMYLSYVLKHWGDLHPHASAILFNIATIAQWVIIPAIVIAIANDVRKKYGIIGS